MYDRRERENKAGVVEISQGSGLQSCEVVGARVCCCSHANYLNTVNTVLYASSNKLDFLKFKSFNCCHCLCDSLCGFACIHCPNFVALLNTHKINLKVAVLFFTQHLKAGTTYLYQLKE